MKDLEDPKQDFHKTIRGIKVYAKNPRRAKTEPRRGSRNGYCRILSVAEIAKKEKELRAEGVNINLIHVEEMKMDLLKRFMLDLLKKIIH